MVRRSTSLTRMALATLFVLAALALTAPLAGAAGVRVKARVEGLSGTVARTTTIDVPAPATFSDSSASPNSATFTAPVAMGALAVLADAEVFPFTANADLSFLNSIAGVGGPPDWTSWWLFSVNGRNPDVGIADPGSEVDEYPFALRASDSVVFYEVDATAPWLNKQLVVRVTPRRGLLPGQAVTISVFGDDLAKANSAADARRWSLDTTADVETPSQFPGVAGATVHVGRAEFLTQTGSSITFLNLSPGTYRVWAEKAPDASFNYVRSDSVKINVDDPAKITNLRVKPSPYRAARRMAMRFSLDKAAKVSARIVNGRGRTVAKFGARTMSAGSRALYWSGKTRTALTSRLTVKVQSVDSWGRKVTKSRSVRVVR